jgi:Uma2 family endonuclease
MATPSAARVTLPATAEIPLLISGDRMTQEEFHERYEQYPGDTKFELIGGIVYMASPLTKLHSDYDDEVGFILGLYRRATHGVDALHNATAIMSEEDEPQPDLGLRIQPEYGGQSRTNEKHYLVGAPELVAEIAYSRRAIDLHAKRDRYEAAGVIEYLVVNVEQGEVVWHHFPSEKRIRPDKQGIARSRVFPGLWFDVPALLARDSAKVREVAEQGLASPQHAAFIKRLQARRDRDT